MALQRKLFTLLLVLSENTMFQEKINFTPVDFSRVAILLRLLPFFDFFERTTL